MSLVHRRTGRLVLGTCAAAALAAGCADRSSDVVMIGTVERTLIELVAPISEIVVELPVRRGERVRPGATVARLDSTLAETDLASAEATVAGARTTAAVAEQERTRIERLKRAGVASAQDLDAALRARDEASARLADAEARLAAARRHLADLRVVSPVAGIVDQLPFDVGERVPAGAVLAVVVADDEPWVRVWTPERALVGVHPGATAEVRVDGIDGPLAGRVLEVAHEPEFTPHFALTERERVHLVYETRVAIADAPPGLRPGMPAEVTVRLRVANAEGGP